MAAATQTIDRSQAGNAVMAVIRDGRVHGVHAASIGAAVNADTVFQTASLSKWLTAWGVMALAQQGKLDLDAPVSRYLKRWTLPPSAFDNNKVTARRLLEPHRRADRRAGLRRLCTGHAGAVARSVAHAGGRCLAGGQWQGGGRHRAGYRMALFGWWLCGAPTAGRKDASGEPFEHLHAAGRIPAAGHGALDLPLVAGAGHDAGDVLRPGRPERDALPLLGGGGSVAVHLGVGPHALSAGPLARKRRASPSGAACWPRPPLRRRCGSRQALCSGRRSGAWARCSMPTTALVASSLATTAATSRRSTPRRA